jgi:hypothetical protein
MFWHVSHKLVVIASARNRILAACRHAHRLLLAIGAVDVPEQRASLVYRKR